MSAATAQYSHTSGLLVFVLHDDAASVSEFMWLLAVGGPQNGCEKSAGGVKRACWLLVTKFAVSHPGKAIEFLGRKKSSARLPSGRGSKAVGPMS
jgi:hypothetical protein